MEEPGFMARIWQWIISPRGGCSHNIVTAFTAEVFTAEGYERCSGAGFCTRCEQDFFVHVPANQVEKNEAMGYAL